MEIRTDKRDNYLLLAQKRDMLADLPAVWKCFGDVLAEAAEGSLYYTCAVAYRDWGLTWDGPMGCP